MKKNRYIELWEAARNSSYWQLKDLPEAENIASQSLEKMLRLKKQPKHQLYWIKTIAYNASIDYLRHQKVVRNYTELALLEEKQNWHIHNKPEWEPDDEEAAFQADMDHFLTNRPLEITQELYLKVFTKKSYTEISAITGRSETAIKKSNFRTMLAIRDIVARYPIERRGAIESLASILEACQITTIQPEEEPLDD